MRGIYTLDDLREYGRKKGVCPYYLARDMVLHANIVIWSYQYLIDPKISQLIMGDIDTKTSIVVFDEAHNIDSTCIDSLSVTLTQRIMERSRYNMLFVESQINQAKQSDASKLQQEYQALLSGFQTTSSSSSSSGSASNAIPLPILPDHVIREAMPGKLSMPAADVSEGSHCGAAFGDLDGDGDLDLVTTEHGVPARIHVFQNRGVKNAEPDLIEVSQEIGLGELFPKGTRELPIKTAHVSLQDFDNDGRIDLLLTVIAKSADGVLQPVVLKNLSSRPGELRFQPLPFDRMTTYYAPGPVADFDRDGRLDIFLPSWFENVPNALFRNVTEGGHWLTVRVVGQSPKRNSMGVGATVRIFAAGHLGDDPHRMGRADISIGNGYASGEEALAHFGLGKQTTCDVLVSWGQQHVERKNVSIGKLLTIEVP